MIGRDSDESFSGGWLSDRVRAEPCGETRIVTMSPSLIAK